MPLWFRASSFILYAHAFSLNTNMVVFQQKLTVYYNCIGAIETPDELAIPQAEVLINTRKGVAVSYLVNSDATPTSQQAIA